MSFIKRLLKKKLTAINTKLDIINDVDKANNVYRINFSDHTGVIMSPFEINNGHNIFIGKNSRVGRQAWLGALEKYEAQNFKPAIRIGDNVKIGNYACITAINEVIIKDGCLMSEYVYISDHLHGFDPSSGISPAIQPLETKGPVIIGENSFIGYRVCILPGVKLGKHCVVGANAVVTRSFPDYSMIAGVPAKLIKKFNFDLNQWVSM